MKTKFDEQLEEMHVELIKMGSLCEQAITLSSRALLGDEKNQVEQVYSVDSEIDQQEREIENICIRLLLLQRPFASDLRKISAALKMISDMERIGDQASDIADMVPYIRFSEAKSKVHIEAMAKAYISTQLANSIVFAVLIVTLLVRPTGLLGKYMPEKD